MAIDPNIALAIYLLVPTIIIMFVSETMEKKGFDQGRRFLVLLIVVPVTIFGTLIIATIVGGTNPIPPSFRLTAEQKKEAASLNMQLEEWELYDKIWSGKLKSHHINREYYAGRTPLLTICELYKTPPLKKGTVTKLLNMGADFNAVTEYNNNETALHFAIIRKNENQFNELVEYISCADDRPYVENDNTGKAPDHYERSKRALNAKNKNGRTPLHYAVYVNRDWAEKLIKAGADLYVKDNNGYIPLDFAASEKDKEYLINIAKEK